MVEKIEKGAQWDFEELCNKLIINTFLKVLQLVIPFWLKPQFYMTMIFFTMDIVIPWSFKVHFIVRVIHPEIQMAIFFVI